MSSATLPTDTYDRSRRVCAIIVTYNRLALLQEALAAVRGQSRKVDAIVIVDNGSTDSTPQWLASEAGPDFHVVTQPNSGSSGGFQAGLQAAFQTGADWCWCMDDDTVPDPGCLAQMLAAEARYLDDAQAAPLGWICSVVRWSDGALHRMNEPKVEGFMSWGADILRQGFVPAQWCSYVSVAISREALVQCGLPLRDMFIWYDDVEFTARITAGGFAGLVALESRAEHRTAANYAPDVEDLDAGNLWRFRRAFCNEVIFLKTRYPHSSGKFWFQYGRMMLRRLFLMVRAGKFRFVPMAMWQGWRGLLAAMPVTFPQPRETANRHTPAPASSQPLSGATLSPSIQP